MHLGIVPVTVDGRLSAKALFTPETLRQLQTDFAAEVGDKYGLQRGKEGSDAKHLDELTFKVRARRAELEGVESSLEAKREELQNTSQELQKAREELETIKGEADGLRQEKEALSEEIGVIRAVRDREDDLGRSEHGDVTWQQLKEREKRTREKAAWLDLLERFIAHPLVAPLWERLRPLLEKEGKSKKKEKKHDEHER